MFNHFHSVRVTFVLLVLYWCIKQSCGARWCKFIPYWYALTDILLYYFCVARDNTSHFGFFHCSYGWNVQIEFVQRKWHNL